MITLAIICLLLALVSGAFGFTGLSGAALSAAKFLVLLKVVCFLFLMAFVGLVALGMFQSRRVR